MQSHVKGNCHKETKLFSSEPSGMQESLALKCENEIDSDIVFSANATH